MKVERSRVIIENCLHVIAKRELKMASGPQVLSFLSSSGVQCFSEPSHVALAAGNDTWLGSEMARLCNNFAEN
eukprot:2418420-Rhodomonas_salina.2